jgi:hypothetical protein
MPSERGKATEWLMDALCVDLGICLPAQDRVRLVSEAEHLTIEEFVDALLLAEGMSADDDLRPSIIDKIARSWR